jgi:large subunit ribosomal protein L24
MSLSMRDNMKNKFKVGDQVVVITGKYKGVKSKVMKVLTDDSKLLLEGVNMQHHFIKTNVHNPDGGIQKKEGLIHSSNVQLFDPNKGKPSKIGYRFDQNGNKQRFYKSSGELVQ